MKDLLLYISSDYFDMNANDSTLHVAAKTLDELEVIHITMTWNVLENGVNKTEMLAPPIPSTFL